MVFRSPSGFVVVVLGAVAIALLFFPVPLHTDDSGWIWDLCGSLLDKPVVDHPFPDIEATNCELQGVYRRRILVVGATLGLAWLVACGVMVRADARRCSWTRFGVSALAAALAIGVLWSQNDRLRPTSIKLAEPSESVTRQIEAKSDSWDKSLLSP